MLEKFFPLPLTRYLPPSHSPSIHFRSVIPRSRSVPSPAPFLETLDPFNRCTQMLNLESPVIDREYQKSHSLRRYDPIHDCAQSFSAKDDVVKIARCVMREDESR